MAWLLDTNILSEIRRLKPEPKVLAFVSAHALDELYVSAVRWPSFGSALNS
jgi:predicted nucleic acid-binding protein